MTIFPLYMVVFLSFPENDNHLNSSNLMKHEKLIKRYVDANETRELACLHGIQNLVVVQMLSPQGSYTLFKLKFYYLFQLKILSFIGSDYYVY